MKDIKEFRIGKAFYILQNLKGSKLKLEVDYANNEYTCRVLNNSGNIRRLKVQAGIIAAHMLGKKAQKNLRYKLLQLKV